VNLPDSGGLATLQTGDATFEAVVKESVKVVVLEVATKKGERTYAQVEFIAV
jgi:hypothetical protein